MLLIQEHSNDLGTIGLSVQDVIAASCSALGARRDVLKCLFVAHNDPLKFGKLLQEHPVLARGKIHRALCAARYLQILKALSLYVSPPLPQRQP